MSSGSRQLFMVFIAAFSVVLGVAAMMRSRPKPPRPSLTLAPEAVHEAEEDGFALHRALRRGDEQGASEALEGADPNALDREGRSPLMLACEKRLLNAARQLLDAGADVNLRNDEGTTALVFAATNGDDALVALLLDRGARAFVANKAGVTPLHAAMIGGQERVVRRLLDAGARPNAQDADGRTPLHLAALSDHAAALALLASHGADLELRDRERGATALHLAAGSGHVEAVAKLVELGAELDAPDASGRTPLDYAKFGDEPQAQAAALLEAKGAKAGLGTPPP